MLQANTLQNWLSIWLLQMEGSSARMNVKLIGVNIN